jgi:hypothetical protein
MPPLNMYVFIYVSSMCTSQAPEGLDVFCLYSIFKSLYIIGYFSVHMNIVVLKVGDLKMGTKSEIRFSRKQFKYFNRISVIYGDDSPKQNCIGAIFRNKRCMLTRGPNAKYQFSRKAHLTGWTDLFLYRI